jgi:hypothetical protein
MSHATHSDLIANDTGFFIFLCHYLVAEIYHLSVSSTFLSFINEFEMQKKCKLVEKDYERNLFSTLLELHGLSVVILNLILLNSQGRGNRIPAN